MCSAGSHRVLLSLLRLFLIGFYRFFFGTDWTTLKDPEADSRSEYLLSPLPTHHMCKFVVVVFLFSWIVEREQNKTKKKQGLTLQLDNGGLELLESLVDVILRLRGDQVGRRRFTSLWHVAPFKRAGRQRR